MNRDDSDHYAFLYSRLQAQSTKRLERIMTITAAVIATFSMFLMVNIFTLLFVTTGHLVIDIVGASASVIAILVTYIVRGAAIEIWDSRDDKDTGSH